MGRHIFVVMATIALFGRTPTRRRAASQESSPCLHRFRCWRILWQRNGRFEYRWWRFECRWRGCCWLNRSCPHAWNMVRVARRPRLDAFCVAGRGRGFSSSDGLRRSCYFVASTQQALRRIKELLIDPDCAGIAVPIGDAFSSSTIRRHRWRDSRTRRRVTR
jgi:hypothetical protein